MRRVPLSRNEARTPVRPLDAASVILLRERSGATEVLMGRRRKRASFLPDIYVFPGGRVDAADRVVLPEALRLAEDTERLLRRDTPKASPVALALAALRETHEETGYLVARPAGPAILDSFPDAPFWNACRKAGVVPDLPAMDYIMRAVTPTISRKRFNTRFFLVDATDLVGEPLCDGELEDLRWLPLEAAFRLPIIDVTEFALETANRRRSDWREGRRQSTIPFMHYVRDRQRIDHV